MTDIEKATLEANLAAITLTAINDQLEALLYDIRIANNDCVSCGKHIGIDGVEFCEKCLDDSRDDIFRDLEQDQRVT